MKTATHNHPRSTPLPFVLINMAMTADGKIATANRAISSFSSRRDHDHLLALRATADAVMAGARTVDLNPINMGPGPAKYRRLRQRRGLAEFNLRVIVSRSGTVATNAEIFRRRFSPIIILTTRRASARRLSKLRAVASEVKVCGATEIDLREALRWLRRQWGVKRLLCEGGGELNDALFRAGVVDELHLTICPTIFGGRTAPTIVDGIGAGSLARAGRLRLKSATRSADELFLVYSKAQIE
jgi:2,5-diamino-6-(ribosylamino)-4(3H)-pyrimidinone 5'-phosphate reductase